MADFPELDDGRTDVAQLFCVYLDYFRQTVEDKLTDLDEAALRTSRLPSGWTPLEMVSHLLHMERRWLQWGFLGADVDAPWGDRGDDDRWHVSEAETLESLVARLHAGGAETTRIVREHRLTEVGRPGPRWEGAEPAALVRILFHVSQEYARHVGHLDIVCELAEGTVGE